MRQRWSYQRALMMAVFCCCISTAFAGSSFEAQGGIRQIALKAQSKLPKLAIDGLLEAQRKSAQWRYALNIRMGKTWVEQVQVTLEQINSMQSKVTVEVVRVQGGLLFSSTEQLPNEVPLWTRRIQAALK